MYMYIISRNTYVNLAAKVEILQYHCSVPAGNANSRNIARYSTPNIPLHSRSGARYGYTYEYYVPTLSIFMSSVCVSSVHISIWTALWTHDMCFEFD